jgi:hypothetical protein
MATKNVDHIAQVAEVLLAEIEKAAAQHSHPDQLKTLSEAWALIAGGDPRQSQAARSGSF